MTDAEAREKALVVLNRGWGVVKLSAGDDSVLAVAAALLRADADGYARAIEAAAKVACEHCLHGHAPKNGRHVYPGGFGQTIGQDGNYECLAKAIRTLAPTTEPPK